LPTPRDHGDVLLWIGVSISAYFAETKSTFFAVAVTAGLGLGRSKPRVAP